MNAPTTNLWKNYVMATNLIIDELGGTSNIVGEFAERLVAEYYGGKQMAASSKSADVRLTDGKTIQVKARMPRQTLTTSLGVIRSWDFDYLVAVLFSTDGSVVMALEMGADVARSLAKPNDHQNGWVITTTLEFLNHTAARDITPDLNRLLGEAPGAVPAFAGKPLTRSEAPVAKTKKMITQDMVEELWKEFVNINRYGGDFWQAGDRVARSTGMNPGSASIYLSILSNLVSGEENRRNMKMKDLEYYMERIREELGTEAFNNALTSLEKSVPYWNAVARLFNKMRAAT